MTTPAMQRAGVQAAEDPQRVVSDLVAQATAGAELVSAIYHSAAKDVIAMPDPVLHAYTKALAAYGMGRQSR